MRVAASKMCNGVTGKRRNEKPRNGIFFFFFAVFFFLFSDAVVDSFIQ